jgi:RNA polymerase sigma factor (sigma-70 family)
LLEKPVFLVECKISFCILPLETERVPSADGKEVDNIMSNMARTAEIFEQHGDFIRRVLRYRIGDEALVDDLYQDFFLSLVARPIPADVRNVKNYLYRAIINDSFDAVRRVEQYQDRIQRYSKRIENPINKDRPENALIENEETEKMLRMIELLLPSSESRSVTLRFKNDNSIGEVAKQMAVNKRSVSRYISVGLRKIRQLLVEKGGA